MKRKSLSLILTLALLLGSLLGCSQDANPNLEQKPSEQSQSQNRVVTDMAG